MKTLNVLIFVVFMISCSNENEGNLKVTSLDQLNGTWKCESTCGGIINNCIYPSISNYSELDLSNGGQYVHKTNGTIDLKAKYT